MSYVTTELGGGDPGPILDLWIRNLAVSGRADAAARHRWLSQNPAGAPVAVLARSGDVVVGCGSFFPRPTLVDRRCHAAGIVADFAVDRAHRSAGAALTIQRALQARCAERGLAFLYGWPNRSSAPIFARVGYRVVGQTSYWVRPLRARGHVLRRLDPRLPGLASRLLAGLGGAVADACLVADALRRCGPDAHLHETRVLDHLGPEVDDLLRRAPPGWLMGEKSAAYLRWRYAAAPGARHRFFCLHRKHGALSGYLVYTHREDGVHVVDLFAEDLRATLDQLLGRFTLHAASEGAASILVPCLGPTALTERLRAHRFFQRPLDRPVLAYLPPGAPRGLESALFDPRRWLALEGELDLG